MPTYGPALAVDDVVEMISVCKTTDQIGLNIFHYKVTTINVLPSALSLLVDRLLVLNFDTAMRALISSAAEYRGLMTRILKPTLSVQFLDSRGAGGGTVGGDLLPRQVSGLLSKRSAVAGRRKGGRFYVPFPGEDDNAATSVPTAGYVARLDTLGITLASQLNFGLIGVAVPVIYQRPPRFFPLLYDTRGIATIRSNPAWATQRRRGSFGRVNISPL